MIRYICDRCGHFINSDYYYKININSYNKKTHSDFYYQQLLSNLCVENNTVLNRTNFVPTEEEDRIYCVNCKEKIEKFLESDQE